MSQQKAGKYAEGQDLEKVGELAKMEAADVESERLVLVDSKTRLEKDLFKKRLELEKSQWIYQTKSQEYDELKEKVQFELNLKGLSIDQVEAVNFEENSQILRQEIDEYDTQKSALADKIENLYTILNAQPDGIPQIRENLAEKVADLQNKIDLLTQAVEQLEKARQEKMSAYLSSSNHKIKIATATAEAQAYAKLKKTLHQNGVMDALLEDKVNDVLRVAEKYCQVLCGKDYKLQQHNGIASIVFEGETVAVDNLETKDKVLLYLALNLAQPRTKATSQRWVLFDEQLPVEAEVLSKAIRKIENVYCLVDVSKVELAN